MANALSRYMAFLEALEPYPEWKDKAVEEIGKWFHMIHNNLAESDAKHNFFLKLVGMIPLRTARTTLSDSNPIDYHSYLSLSPLVWNPTL